MKRTRTVIGMLLALMLILSFALTACGGNTDNSTPNSQPSNNPPATSSTNKPNQGEKLELTVTPETVEIYAGDKFTPLMGVQANLEGASVRVSDAGDFDSETPGTYTITYEAILGDQKVTATRTVIVLEALSSLTMEVVKNNMTAGKWEGVLMSFENKQYHALTADFTTTEALTGVFHNTSDQPIIVTIGGKMGEVAIINANGVVIEGRDGANGKMVNAENPIRANSPGPNATITVDGEEVKMADNFAKAMTVPAGGYAIVVQTGAFGETFDFDGRGFMAQSVIHQLNNVIRLYWTDTEEELTEYVDQKPIVSGNTKFPVLMGDTSFNLEQSVVTDLVAMDDNGTFTSSDDVKIEEFTIVDNGGFDINVPGEYIVKLSVTDGNQTTEFTRVIEVKADGANILQIGEKAPFFVEDGKWSFNTQINADEAAKYKVLIFDKTFTGTVEEYKFGAAIVLDQDGVLVKIYDGANVQYWTVDGKAASAHFGQADYAPKAFAELQEGEILFVFPHNGTNRNWALSLRNAPNGPSECGKVAEVTGFGFPEKPSLDKTITIGEKAPFVAEEGKWAFNTQISAADAANYKVLIFDKTFTGTVEEYKFGAAIVLDQYGTLVKIYDGANVQYWTADGKAASAHFGQADYAPKAFAELQEGEILFVFPHNDTNRNWALSLRNAPNGPSECGKVATVTGFTFEEKKEN